MADLNAIAALPPPAGQRSNFDHPQGSGGHSIYITAGICLTLSTVAVILRVFTKARVLKSMHLEEYILIVSQLGLYAVVGILIYAVHTGLGNHEWDVSAANSMQVMKLINITEMTYLPTILGARVAMMLQMQRLFIVSKRGALFWIFWTLLCVNITCNVSLFIGLACACIPRPKIWDPAIPGRCVSIVALCLSSSTLNGISDLTMLILPLVVIIKLQLPVKAKVYLCMIFGTGILAVMSSMLRLGYGVIFANTLDSTWAWEPVGHWAVAEITANILAGSVPLLPGFMKYARTPENSQASQSSSTFKSWFKGKQSSAKWNGKSLSNTRTSISKDRTLVATERQVEFDAVPTSRGNSDPELGVMKSIQVETSIPDSEGKA